MGNFVTSVLQVRPGLQSWVVPGRAPGSFYELFEDAPEEERVRPRRMPFDGISKIMKMYRKFMKNHT